MKLGSEDGDVFLVGPVQSLESLKGREEAGESEGV